MPETIRESISFSLFYRGADDEEISHTVSWDTLPDQHKVWDRMKQMIDTLYTQVR